MNEQKYVCPSCSGLINYGTKFCPHCGTALNFSPLVQNDSVVNQNINNLQTQAEFHLAKIRLLHTLISVITFNETEVNVKQFNKWLPFVKTNPGTANFNVMDIESAYVKKSYNGKMSALLILCILVLLAAQEVILLVLIIGLAFSLRDTALIIKYKGGYLKLFNDKSLFDSEKRDDPQLVLDYIKQYNPDCVHVLMD